MQYVDWCRLPLGSRAGQARTRIRLAHLAYEAPSDFAVLLLQRVSIKLWWRILRDE